MKLIVRGHGVSITKSMKEYAAKKMAKIDHFFTSIQKAEVTLDARNTDNADKRHVAEITLWAAGKKVIRAAEAGSDMYAAIDLVIDEIGRQTKKHKDKMVMGNRRISKKAKESSRNRKVSDMDPGIQAPMIVPVERFAPKPMLPEEAIDEVKLLNQNFMFFFNPDTKSVNLAYKKGREVIVVDPEDEKLKNISADAAIDEISRNKNDFLMFLNRETRKVNVIYKRSSGNYGLIEPRA